MALGAYSLRGDKDCALALTPETAGEPLSPGKQHLRLLGGNHLRRGRRLAAGVSSTLGLCTVFAASRDQQGEPGKYINAAFCTSVDSAEHGADARSMLADTDPAFYWLQQ